MEEFLFEETLKIEVETPKLVILIIVLVGGLRCSGENYYYSNLKSICVFCSFIGWLWDHEIK